MSRLSRDIERWVTPLLITQKLSNMNNRNKFISYLDSLTIADYFIKEHLTQYTEYHFIEFTQSDNSYRFIFSALDYYSRAVKLEVFIDFLHQDISCGVVLAKESLSNYFPRCLIAEKEKWENRRKKPTVISQTNQE